MLRHLSLLLVLTLAIPAHAASEASLRIVKLEPTVLFPDREPLCQIAWLHVVNPAESSVTVEATVVMDGTVSGAPQRFTLPPGGSRQNLLVPDIPRAARLEVRLTTTGQPAAQFARDWQPQRKWKVFVVKSSHEDIGYENYLWVKQKEIADFIDLGAHLSSKTKAAPVEEGAVAPGGYRYFLETLLFPRYYMEERSEMAWRELAENAVKSGAMPLAAAPNGVHSHWLDYESLARLMYPGRREYKDRFDLDLDTFVIVDNPSFSWSSVQAMAGAGYRYAVRFAQPFRTDSKNDYRTTKLPAVFWWQGPDATSRVLYTWRHHYGINFWFGQTNGGFTDLSVLAAENVQREIAAVQDDGVLGPYPYDALLIPSYQDHETPVWDNRALRRWQETYRYPEISIAGPRDFMVYMEKNYGGALPVLSGDLNNFSADYASIDPASHGWTRRASRLLPFAEGLAAVAGALDPGFTLPAHEVERAYLRLFDFSEHSWPTSPPAGPVHQFNAQWGKHLEGGRALADSERLFDRAIQAVSSQIATGEAPALAVFNPLAHSRTDLVVVNEKLSGGALIDASTGTPVATQTLADGRTVFLAGDVPAFGYKTYRLAPPPAAGPVPVARLRAEGNILENEYYTITFDRASGAITSIVDRELKRELVDSAAPYQFNQLVWVSKKSKQTTAGSNYAPKKGARLAAQAGPFVAEMTASFADAKLGDAQVVQTVRLYAGMKRIDVVNTLRHVGALHTDRSTHRYRDNLFYAFPFKVENFTPRAEYAGGVVRPQVDQLRHGTHDYLSVNRWADVSNADFGVTMAPHNAPVVHFGAIRYNEFSIDYKPSTSHLYSYAWSNRMAGLLALGPDDLNATFAYSFTSHAGDWDAGAVTRFGWGVASPLVARVLPASQPGKLPATADSFLKVDAPNVQVTVLKESTQPGRGWIVRLVETEGRAVEATVDVGRLPVDQAVRCDLVENDLGPLALTAGKVRVSLGAFAFATVRVFAQGAPSAVTGLAVTSTGDAGVGLRWPAVAGAVGYNVFRSEDPDAPATAWSFAGRAVEPAFTDAGLKLDTVYFYRLAAVSAGNAQGEPSARLEVRTATENTTPPLPVTELGIVRQAHDRLMVCWHRNTEPDVARYLVYRSTQPDFDPTGMEAVGVVRPSGYYLEHFIDAGLTAGTTYHYKVLPQDWAGNRQTRSATASATTPKSSP